MGSSKLQLPTKAGLTFKSSNKGRRQTLYINQKKTRDSERRQERFQRKREEAKNPLLREKRLKNNVPQTIDTKRTWDQIDGEDVNLGMAVDLEAFSKRRRLSEVPLPNEHALTEEVQDGQGWGSDADSMLDVSDEPETDKDEHDEHDEHDEAAPTHLLHDVESSSKKVPNPNYDDFENFSDEDEEADDDEPLSQRESSVAPSLAPSLPMSTTSTRLDLTPESLVAKFPTLFNPSSEPKILLTTSLNSTLHTEADLLSTMFPNCVYIRRSAHRFSHKYSIREISKFAANRAFTTVIVLMEEGKRPVGLDVVHLPKGPMFHFSMTNWVQGRKLPGHGNPTNHKPELIIHNFKTPLGMLTAALFQSMFPAQPELQGRQVVTLHNQRDYIFIRRHRYIFRDRRPSEKSVADSEGKTIEGVQDIKAGLQELGPRFTLKLRRVDRGIQRTSGQEWNWKGNTDRIRTKFQI